MKKFLVKLLLFIVLFFIYDKLFIIITNRSAGNVDDKRLEYLVRGEINKDVIVTGSSRGHVGIIAGNIEKGTGLSAYNLCFSGADIEFNEFLLRALVKFNEPPKYLLIVVDDSLQFIKNDKIFFQNNYLYYLVNYPYIWEELSTREGKNKFIANFLVLYKLNKYSFRFQREQHDQAVSVMECGFMPLSMQDEGFDWKYVSTESKYSPSREIPEKIDAYASILKMCHDNNITPVIVFPPYYHEYSNSFEDRMRQLSGDSIRFLVYDRENPVYLDKDYYFDDEHLRINGAKIFTQEIIRFLEESESD
jgi:hypothetical protein